MTARRHTASHALATLTAHWFDDEDRADLRRLGYWLAVCAATCVLGFLLGYLGPALDAFDAWRARAAGLQQQVEDAHWINQHAAQRLQAIAAHRAQVQATCGPETACRPHPKTGAGVCTSKRGLVGATACQLAEGQS